ncbi:hypothetical protein GUJ93_ZPchr0009g1453 [Zizania palustris]|uniref:Uncharacterized protein n=1 Tax=Zizania palustris TaxID=103762 RepID=A0A8J5R2G0_ZIZPA|nr:hypothetical protein GUJ93_ZPchr0009g1453 [Zizania palustris]
MKRIIQEILDLMGWSWESSSRVRDRSWQRPLVRPLSCRSWLFPPATHLGRRRVFSGGIASSATFFACQKETERQYHSMFCYHQEGMITEDGSLSFLV